MSRDKNRHQLYGHCPEYMEFEQLGGVSPSQLPYLREETVTASCLVSIFFRPYRYSIAPRAITNSDENKRIIAITRNVSL
jgi:hypothetical protein